MNLDDYLESVELIDCTGQITHRLVLLIDGRVRVEIGAATSIVDPSTRRVTPGSRQLGRGEYGHQQIIDIACQFAKRR